MNDPSTAESDYPYARPNAENDPAAAAYASMARRGRFRRWLSRLAIGIGVPLLLLLTGAGILTYRAARQAWAISFLEQRGCSITYRHQPPTNRDYLPASLRDLLTDAWWGDVTEVFFHSSGVWGGYFSYELDEHDLQAIFGTCGMFNRLESISVSSDYFACDQIARWPRLRQLTELYIKSAKIADSDFAVIGKMTELKTLALDGGTISADGLVLLGQLPKLEHLTLQNIRFRPSTVPASVGFSSLKSLVVSRSAGFNDDAIAVFGSLPNLEDINFNQTPIGDKGLAQLMRSGKIRSLIVSDGSLTDATFTLLSGYRAPGWLVLSGMPLTDAGLASLAGKSFPALILDRTAVTDEAFRTLNRIHGLEFVSLASSRVTGDGARWLRTDRVLDDLDVGGPNLTAAGIQAVAKARCRRLRLDKSNLGDSDLMLFANNDDLEYISSLGRRLVT
jgi:hypothetical protein